MRAHAGALCARTFEDCGVDFRTGDGAVADSGAAEGNLGLADNAGSGASAEKAVGMTTLDQGTEALVAAVASAAGSLAERFLQGTPGAGRLCR